MLEDNWTGLYREGWGSRLRPASYSHPAKAAYALTVRIYEHALEEGWIKPGQIVLDPFAGIGGFALEAMRHGLHFVGCELEQRFVDMGQGCDCTGISKEDWARFQGRWDKMHYEGDRHWCPECVMKAGAVADEREFKPLPLPGTKWAALAKTRQTTLFDTAPSASYVRNSGRIPCTEIHHYRGNIETWERQGMAGSAVIVQGDSRRLGEVLERANLCLSSPPYANQPITGKRCFKSRFNERPLAKEIKAADVGYSGDSANLGNLPDTGFEAALDDGGTNYEGTFPEGHCPPPIQEGGTAGNVALALSSPVYIGNTASDAPDKRGGLYRDPKRRNDKTLTATYSEDAAQLAQMPEGDLVLALGSPPYGGSLGNGKSGIDWSKQADRETAYPHGWDGENYGIAAGQLAALPEGDHAAALGAGAETGRAELCLSSPPYEGLRADIKGHGIKGTARVQRDKNYGNAEYGSAPGQLGQETGSTFWAASRQILEEVYRILAPGAHAIFVCKRFVRDKKIVEFPLQWARLCEAVGFTWIHHHKAWLVEDRGAQHTLEGGLEERVVKRFSFFRRLHSQKYPELEISWEDVLCFVKT